ncbi:unnamed protein product [Lepeophtheirus salmonis]|uniref:(salmon louse) hypothetical protein n=1 Tax=Lepeophtheirus salmonis TaxID=72036 RepID=A0A7R8H561_LEPSM|nr:unnamed protein product [Lepeophtheirus salmonis]CAF2858847.1 unnamed protein product [Lepeophtheirus salmonis]
MFEKVESSDKFINEHLDQFATVEVMRQYGYCLETFESNTVSLNEAIFKIMNYVSVDLNAPESSFIIPQILNIFSEVLERDLFVGDNLFCQKWKRGVLEPIPYYSLFCNESIPNGTLEHKPRNGDYKKNYFLMLLKKIGINLPTDRSTRFPRIPKDCDDVTSEEKLVTCQQNKLQNLQSPNWKI